MKDFMKSVFQKIQKDKRGFTLIEMLITLLVVSLLMAIIIPNIAGQRERINTQARENITEIIQTQKNSYQMVEGEIPSLDQLLEGGYITEKQLKEARKHNVN